MRDSWQDFQADFGRYLRDPEQEKLPEGVVPRRAKVYEELLFKNVCGFLNSCFPICKTLIVKDEWTSLARDFFRDWRCHSPRFNDIPKEFLDYLASDISPELRYPWLLQFAHYEWVELAVDTFDESGVELNRSADEGHICVNPALHNLIYDWPVHQISPDYLPTEQKLTFLLVYRNAENEVAFTEVNAATSALINLFEQGDTKSEEVLPELAAQMNIPFNHAFKDFGLDMINQLIAQGILIDVQASI
jgi:hypothetical protein